MKFLPMSSTFKIQRIFMLDSNLHNWNQVSNGNYMNCTQYAINDVKKVWMCFWKC